MRYVRVIVTGGKGFLGRHLLSVMSQRGWSNVVAIDLEDYDLTDPSQIRIMLRNERPDVVIHLAAVVGGIGANQRHPGKFFYENAAMGIHLIEECRLYGLRKLVLIGTICAYPKFTPAPFKEHDLWNGYPEETNAPYGLAKKMLLVQSQAYRTEYGLNSIFLLPVNLYGPGDNFDPQSSHVIPALIRKFVLAKEQGSGEVEIWGTGKPSREFIYVTDAAEGIALATERYNEGEPVNIGTGYEITIAELAKEIAILCEYEGKMVFNPAYPDGQPRRCLDVSKARELFGFTAKTTLSDGLRKTVDWYQAQHRAERFSVK